MTEQASNILSDEDGPAGPPAGGETISFEDAVLVERTRKGDMQAFGSLVAKYQDRIVNLVFRLCGRRADAEELAQDAFLKAMEKLGQFRGESGFYTWLFRLASNLAISHRRRVGRINFNSLSAGEDMDGTQAASLTAELAGRRELSPPAAAQAAENERRVVEALEALDDESRLVVLLRDIEEMDYAEIARTLELPAGTVKSRLHRARCRMKEQLSDLMDG